MSDPTLPLSQPLQMTWHRPTHRAGCARVPEAGPGSCTYWWEGCPQAEHRGCYQLWAAAQFAAGHVPDGPGKAKPPQETPHD